MSIPGSPPVSDPLSLSGEPLVSVQMITYNHRDYVAKAIEGVLSQKTTFPFELVIGEDCSTDGTREIVLEYQRRFPSIIRVITSDANVGMRKNGLRTLLACRGKYVACCEGDDYWHRNDKLQIQVDLLERHPECGLVCSEYDVLNVATGQRIRNFVQYRRCKIPSTRSIEDFIAGRADGEGNRIGCSIRVCTMVGRRDLIIRTKNADPFLHQSERFMMGDTQLCAEINMVSSIMFVPESLATHNILPESASRSRSRAKRLRFMMNASELWLYLCDKHKVSRQVREMHERTFYRIMLWLAFQERDARMADKARANGAVRSLQDRVLYLGAKNPVVHRVYQAAAQVKQTLLPRKDDWA